MKFHLPFIESLETDHLRLKDISSMTALNLATFNTFVDFVNSEIMRYTHWVICFQF